VITNAFDVAALPRQEQVSLREYATARQRADIARATNRPHAAAHAVNAPHTTHKRYIEEILLNARDKRQNVQTRDRILWRAGTDGAAEHRHRVRQHHTYAHGKVSATSTKVRDRHRAAQRTALCSSKERDTTISTRLTSSRYSLRLSFIFFASFQAFASSFLRGIFFLFRFLFFSSPTFYALTLMPDTPDTLIAR